MRALKLLAIILVSAYLQKGSCSDVPKRQLQSSQCSTGQGWDSIFQRCSDCFDFDCEECQVSRNTCTRCKPGHYLDNFGFSNSCRSCGFNCESCTTSGRCTRCESGYDLDSFSESCDRNSSNFGSLFGIVFSALFFFACCGVIACCSKMNKKKARVQKAPLVMNMPATAAPLPSSNNTNNVSNFGNSNNFGMNNNSRFRQPNQNFNPMPPPIQTINAPRANMGFAPAQPRPMMMPMNMGQVPMGQPVMMNHQMGAPMPFQPVHVQPAPRF